MIKIKYSKCPYTAHDIIKMNRERKLKYIKAMIYDFLKKNKKLSLYYDSYMTFHNPKPKGEMTFNQCLEEAVKTLVTNDYAIRDFFYLGNVSFGWGEIIRDEMEKLDRKWLSFIDNIGK